MRYLITMAASFSVPVEAEDKEQAREIVEEFVEGGTQDVAECIWKAEFFVTDIQDIDPGNYDCELGLDAKDPYHFHDLDGE